MSITHRDAFLTFVLGLQYHWPVFLQLRAGHVGEKYTGQTSRPETKRAVYYITYPFCFLFSSFCNWPDEVGAACVREAERAGGLSARSNGQKTKKIEAVCDSGSALGAVVMEGVHEMLAVSFRGLDIFSLPLFCVYFLSCFHKDALSSAYVKCSLLI